MRLRKGQDQAWRLTQPLPQEQLGQDAAAPLLPCGWILTSSLSLLRWLQWEHAMAQCRSCALLGHCKGTSKRGLVHWVAITQNRGTPSLQDHWWNNPQMVRKVRGLMNKTKVHYGAHLVFNSVLIPFPCLYHLSYPQRISPVSFFNVTAFLGLSYPPYSPFYYYRKSVSSSVSITLCDLMAFCYFPSCGIVTLMAYPASTLSASRIELYHESWPPSPSSSCRIGQAELSS